MQKDIIDWVYYGARCIKLPTKTINAIINEIKMILRTSAIAYKRFERVVGKLRHAAIGLSAGRGLCALFNWVIPAKPKVMSLGINGAVHAALLDWK